MVSIAFQKIACACCCLIILSCSSIKPVPSSPVAPQVNGERICVIGDGGTGDKYQYKVAQVMEVEKCTRVIYVGDVIYEYGITSENDKHLQDKFFKPYKALLDNNVPFYMSMGNHDWYLLGTGEAWINLSKKNKNIIYPDYAYAEKIGGLCLFQFEVYKKSKWSRVKEIRKQYDFKDCEFTIGFSHYPYRSAGHHGDADKDQKQYMDGMGVGNFDVYLAGHDHHLADEGYYKNSRLFISGSAGKLRELKGKPEIWGASERGFLIIDYPSLNFYFVSIDSKILHQGTLK